MSLLSITNYHKDIKTLFCHSFAFLDDWQKLPSLHTDLSCPIQKCTYVPGWQGETWQCKKSKILKKSRTKEFNVLLLATEGYFKLIDRQKKPFYTVLPKVKIAIQKVHQGCKVL